METKHYAQYGNTMLQRMKCPDCLEYSFIIKNRFQCCERIVDEFETKKIKLMISSQPKRKIPDCETRKIILQTQDNKCFYCNEPFGTLFWNGSKNSLLRLIIHWDHLQPYSFSYNNLKDNFVASCQICNGIKSNLMFANLEELKNYVKRKRIKKTYYEKCL